MWETDMESEMGDSDYFEAWDTLPVLRTYDKRTLRNAERKEKAAAKRSIVEMRSAEHREAGAADNQKGASSLHKI
jgi:hypothetical protein